jgi:uncharacterized cysteine cluster protein YcgN (CxxCxxCC family)
MQTGNHPPFWRQPLSRLSEQEWESLCDGCGRCCLHKVEDHHSGETFYTRAACRLLDCDSCRCSDYGRRSERVPTCLRITPRNLTTLSRWLPVTCAYRLLAEGRELPPWHPLISGDPDSVHAAGISVRRLAIPERQAGDPQTQIIAALPDARIPG